jgi:hypothetical protein
MIQLTPLLAFPVAFNPRTLIRGESLDLLLPCAPAFAGEAALSSESPERARAVAGFAAEPEKGAELLQLTKLLPSRA